MRLEVVMLSTPRDRGRPLHRARRVCDGIPPRLAASFSGVDSMPWRSTDGNVPVGAIITQCHESPRESAKTSSTNVRVYPVRADADPMSWRNGVARWSRALRSW